MLLSHYDDVNIMTLPEYFIIIITLTCNTLARSANLILYSSLNCLFVWYVSRSEGTISPPEGPPPIFSTGGATEGISEIFRLVTPPNSISCSRPRALWMSWSIVSDSDRGVLGCHPVRICTAKDVKKDVLCVSDIWDGAEGDRESGRGLQPGVPISVGRV